jgi:hypothetical protein
MMTQYSRMKGVPFPALGQGMTGLMLLFGELSIAFGIYPFLGIVLPAAFLLPVSLLLHDSWRLDDPQLRIADKINSTNNMGLLGAVLMLLAIPSSWPLSLVPWRCTMRLDE